MTRRAKSGNNSSCPILAKPMSGLLSEMMASSEGTQFGLDFGVVEVDGGNFEAAKLVTEAIFAQACQLRSFAQRKLADLEEPNGQLETQFIFEDGTRFPARQ